MNAVENHKAQTRLWVNATKRHWAPLGWWPYGAPVKYLSVMKHGRGSSVVLNCRQAYWHRYELPSSAAQIGLAVDLRLLALRSWTLHNGVTMPRYSSEIPNHQCCRSSHNYQRFCTFSHASRGTHYASTQLCDVLLRSLALISNYGCSVAFSGTQWRFKFDYI